MSRREDEEAEDQLMVPQSFYLNMSNCIPEERQFGAVTQIALQKNSSEHAGIFLTIPAGDKKKYMLLISKFCLSVQISWPSSSG